MMQIITAVFGAIREFLKLRSKKLDHKNTEEMKDRAEAQEEVEAKDRAEELLELAQSEDPDVRKKALEEIRRRVAE